jgi:SprT protein
MDTKELHAAAERATSYWWTRFRRIYKTLPETVPPVKLNNRLKTTAGRAWLCERHLDRFIDLSTELLAEHPRAFFDEIIPHELAHIVAFHLFKDNGHGPQWKDVMRRTGVNGGRTHHLVNSKHTARKAGTL